MTGALIILSLFVQPQVTIEGTAARLPVLLEHVSTQGGTKLYCDKLFSDVVLYLQCENLPVGEVEAMIASAVDGKWTDGPQGRVLVRDKGLYASRESAYCKEFADRARRVVRSFQGGDFDEDSAKALRERLLAPPTDPEAIQLSTSKDRMGTPLMRLLTDLVLNADLEKLANLDGGRVVLSSTMPTKVFDRMSIPAGRLAQYDKEQEIWNSLSVPNEVVTNYRNYGLARPSDSNLPSGTVYLALGRQNNFPIFVVAIIVLDRDGKVKANVDSTFLFPELEEMFGPEGLGVPTGEPIQPSERTKQFNAASTFDVASLSPIAKDHFAYKYFVDPVSNEPFDIWIGDAMRPLAVQSSGNLAMPIDDSLHGYVLQLLASERLTPLMLENILVQRAGYEIDRNATRTVLRFHKPNMIDDAAFPRENLRTLMRELEANGYIELETIIEQSPKLGMNKGAGTGIGFYSTRALVPGYERWLQFLPEGMLAVLKCMTPGERARLYKGAELAYGGLSPATQQRLLALVKEYSYWGFVSEPGILPLSMNLRVPFAFANGIPADTVFASKVENGKGISLFHESYDDYAAWNSFDPAKEQAFLIGRLLARNVGLKYWYGDSVSIKFSVRCGQIEVAGGDVFQIKVDMRKPSDKITDLPKELQDAILKARNGG